jgi:hypothetical protein
MSKVYIDIFIPFFTYYNDVHRYNITRVIFKHMVNVRNNLSHKAVFSFTLLGSEGERSKQLAAEFFPATDYYEFNQNDPIFQNKDFFYMLNYKVKTGIKVAHSKLPDIVLWMGSNDYVPLKVFDDIVNFYNGGPLHAMQMYGIDNAYAGENASFVCNYDGNKKDLNIYSEEGFWWNGVSPHPRDKYSYCGGIIGFNRAAYMRYPDIVSDWCFDEGEDEEMMKRKRDINKMTTTGNYFVNIKMASHTEINSLRNLSSYFQKNNSILLFNNLSAPFCEYINKDLAYLLELIRTT